MTDKIIRYLRLIRKDLISLRKKVEFINTRVSILEKNHVKRPTLAVSTDICSPPKTKYHDTFCEIEPDSHQTNGEKIDDRLI